MDAVAWPVPVNPPGISQVLSQAQEWKGLVMEAENAIPSLLT
jgi:hypothetical protein